MRTNKQNAEIAATALAIFRRVYCVDVEKTTDEKPHYMCSKCLFQKEDGTCLIKYFMRHEGRLDDEGQRIEKHSRDC